MITQLVCKVCNRRTEVIEEVSFLQTKIRRKLKCGHSQIVQKLAVQSEEQILRESLKKIESLEGDKAFEHQIDAAIFTLLKANGRVCIFDEVGVGKTIETIISVLSRKDKMLPCIIVCKSVAKMNWLKHWVLWSQELGQIITGSTEKWHDIFPIHILSYEMLRRILDNGTDNNHKAIIERAKTIVIDESHLAKNDTAQRTVAIKKLCEGKPFVFALSGTQVENQAGGLFPIFNIICPDRFHNRDGFLHRYWEMYRDGWSWKIGRMIYPKKLKEDTEDFVIRRKMDDVLPNLPQVRKNNIFVELGD